MLLSIIQGELGLDSMATPDSLYIVTLGRPSKPRRTSREMTA